MCAGKEEREGGGESNQLFPQPTTMAMRDLCGSLCRTYSQLLLDQRFTRVAHAQSQLLTGVLVLLSSHLPACLTKPHLRIGYCRHECEGSSISPMLGF